MLDGVPSQQARASPSSYSGWDYPSSLSWHRRALGRSSKLTARAARARTDYSLAPVPHNRALQTAPYFRKHALRVDGALDLHMECLSVCLRLYTAETHRISQRFDEGIAPLLECREM